MKINPLLILFIIMDVILAVMIFYGTLVFFSAIVIYMANNEFLYFVEPFGILSLFISVIIIPLYVSLRVMSFLSMSQNFTSSQKSMRKK